VKLDKKATALEAEAAQLRKQIDKEASALETKINLLEKHLNTTLGKLGNAHWLDQTDEEFNDLHESLYELLDTYYWRDEHISPKSDKEYANAIFQLQAILKSLIATKKPLPRTEAVYEVCDYATKMKKIKASNKRWEQAVKDSRSGK